MLVAYVGGLLCRVVMNMDFKTTGSLLNLSTRQFQKTQTTLLQLLLLLHTHSQVADPDTVATLRFLFLSFMPTSHSIEVSTQTGTIMNWSLKDQAHLLDHKMFS